MDKKVELNAKICDFVQQLCHLPISYRFIPCGITGEDIVRPPFCLSTFSRQPINSTQGHRKLQRQGQSN